MSTILHILTRPEDALAQEVVAHAPPIPDTRVDVADLTRGEPDYEELLRRIFAADSVHVW